MTCCQSSHCGVNPVRFIQEGTMPSVARSQRHEQIARCTNTVDKQETQDHSIQDRASRAPDKSGFRRAPVIERLPRGSSRRPIGDADGRQMGEEHGGCQEAGRPDRTHRPGYGLYRHDGGGLRRARFVASGSGEPGRGEPERGTNGGCEVGRCGIHGLNLVGLAL